MKYTIIIWSHRKQSQSTKVGIYIKHVLQKLPDTIWIDIIDLKDNPLPLRDEDWKHDNIREPIKKICKQSDGFIIITPERNGMATPAIKNFFIYAKPEEFANKPALLVWVSAGRGWAYPIAELRMSSYKNSQICYIPQHILVQWVNDVLNDNILNENTEKHDAIIKRRIQHSCKLLEQYTIALQSVRNSNTLNLEQFRNGM